MDADLVEYGSSSDDEKKLIKPTVDKKTERLSNSQTNFQKKLHSSYEENDLYNPEKPSNDRDESCHNDNDSNDPKYMSSSLQTLTASQQHLLSSEIKQDVDVKTRSKSSSPIDEDLHEHTEHRRSSQTHIRRQSKSPGRHGDRKSMDRSPPSGRSPIRNLSPGPKEKIPRKKYRSPRRGDNSPRKNDRSPRRGNKSPRRGDRSPRRRDKSPRQRDKSSRRGDRSPLGRDKSPKRKDRSPKRRDRSPRNGGDRTSRREGRNYRGQDRSPRRDERSPRRGNRSPRRRSPQYSKSPDQRRNEKRMYLGGPSKPIPPQKEKEIMSSEEVMKKLAQRQESLKHEAQANAETHNLPSYFNPSIVNPQLYAKQQEKRKLLWSGKKKEETPTNNAMWSGTKFTGDQGGEMGAKFRRLMGIKGESGVMEASDKGPSKGEKILTDLEMEFERSRAFQLSRGAGGKSGIGLGYSSSAYQP
ncbi:arginine/serine-rich coiled-coil protein 2-like isoform X2 [Xenia sp. Carnegie-2017]|uniref:arginine/serine-rich coiled-coil protein 2-like isoform X2 n=1 Tax=Xenia sp. Carnegie-2017 TaxID=2897299 RepID=UPI001F04D8AA|nr:arginine/serine-rich coiled-coil protein 2-like isoform X2 [Xenia sp. Carnegie-2017]